MAFPVSKAFHLSVVLIFAGCGGGGGSLIPEPVQPITRLPGNAQLASTEVNQGSYQIFFAQSEKNLDDPEAEVVVTSGRAALFSTVDGEMRLHTPSGKTYIFNEIDVVQGAGGQSTEYSYNEKTGEEIFLVIKRWADGSRDGLVVVDPPGQPSNTRASFYYGWSTDQSKIPASGIATYSNDGGGQIFLSDGKRLFNGKTSLEVNFTNRTVSGVLVDTIGREQAGVQAKLTLQGGTFNSLGEITAKDKFLLELIDDNNPFTSVTGSEGSLSGTFLGADADAIAGYFTGNVEVTRGSSKSTVSYDGIFGGAKIPTVIITPPKPTPVPTITPAPVTIGQFPQFAENSSAEVGVGAFDLLFAQSQRDPTITNSLVRANITNGRAKIFSLATGEVIVETHSGKRFHFVEDFTNPVTSDTIEYFYREKNGGPETLFLTRDRQGNQRGYFTIGPVGGVADLRTWFHYGYPTDPMQLVSGTATYSHPTEGRLFLSDGWRLFGGATNLSVDFTAGRVDGVLFDNTATTQLPVKATVTLTNGQVQNGQITGAGGINLSLANTDNPYTSVGTVSNGSVDGQFIGANGENLIGSYVGEVNVDHPITGAGPLKFGGSFTTTKQ